MQFIEILKTIVLGIIQGITEWLPISSTGHMILADTFLQLNQPKDFMDMFFVVIQLGSILAVVVLYFNKLNPFAPSKSRAERYSTFQLWAKVLVAVLPVGSPSIFTPRSSSPSPSSFTASCSSCWNAATALQSRASAPLNS